MALTGAFYPSIDLCAGEKERGTMETLLISPASRGEIVMGKFLTVVLASMTTAILNLLSMALTGLQLAYKLAGGSGVSAANFGPPTLMAAFWMIVLLVPLSVFFSAICVALAVLAKSMKEGQYYMTPLYMVSLPLILLTLAPGVDLTPFYSMVPITGVGLLLKSLILGDYGSARRYFIPVLVPMVIYAAVALRWAVDQFRREDVLFRESERFDVVAWLRHLVRNRQPTPTPSQAFFCFTLMICLAWFATQALGDIGSPLVGMGLGHLLFIFLPPVVMTLLFTSDPKRTLRLARPGWRYVGLGLGLAVALNPFVREFSVWADWLFPPPRQVTEHVETLMRSIPNVWIGLLVFAVIPSITEEVAFRGYILSGLERGHRTRTAILISAFLFGFLHVLDQPVQPALHGDAAGHRARTARGSEPEPVAGDPLPPREQRSGGGPGVLDGVAVGRGGDAVALPRRRARAVSHADPDRGRPHLGRAARAALQGDPAGSESNGRCRIHADRDTQGRKPRHGPGLIGPASGCGRANRIHRE